MPVTQKVNLPSKVRAGIYIFNAVATPVVAYLFAKEFIGELEIALWAAEMTAVSTLAALNTNVEK